VNHFFADTGRLLRLALRMDAVVTGANGVAYLTLFGPLEDLLGLDPTVSLALGAFLVAYAVGVWVVSMPAVANRTAVGLVIEANVLWVLLSVAAVAFGWLGLKTVGEVWGVMQAGTVAGFAGLQFMALRRAAAGGVGAVRLPGAVGAGGVRP
jgi:hypothetical protein